MKRTVLATLALSAIVASCSDTSEKKIISVERKVMYKPTVAVNADRKLAVEVSGMSCEHACGGSIRMSLKETNAVDRVSFDFQDDRKVNTAFITFDKSKISADQIIAIIEKINNKQFTTGKVTSSALEQEVKETATRTSNTEKSKSADPKVEVSTHTSYEFPNLYELFSHIIS